MPWYLPAAIFVANTVALIGGARLIPAFRRWRAKVRREAEEQMLMDYYKKGLHREDEFIPTRHAPRKNGQNLR